MDFGFSDLQIEHRKSVQKLSQKLESSRIENVTFNHPGWKLCSEFGIQGGPIPAEYGGKGLDLMTFVSGLEAMGETCTDQGLMFSIGAHVLACELPILNYGTPEQKQQWLPDLCSGKKIAAIAIAEEQGASDAFNIHTTATKKDSGYVLHGKKTYITNAPICDIALVFARITDTDNQIVCLMVDKDTPGLTCKPATEKIGLKTSPYGDLIFDNCWIDDKNQLGPSGELVFLSAMEWERGCILAPMVGAMQRQVNDCVKRVSLRKQNGQPIKNHQALSHRIVDMKMRADIAQLMLYKFVWKKQTQRRANMEASMTKLYSSEALLQNSLDAMQIHGGYGYTVAAGLDRELNDALGLRIASGTSDIQKNIIAKWLKL